ncbi:hypothetical protein M2459_001233 [Parabacteroides sp. PF5-5]|uniref:hypothetical protein n=1 Tax=unclassified Parabacteroides TaxID=2649774 RepID=UPI002473EF00|nr:MULTISPECIES: hypothetical protein [unclassified Parabacteroides]MDH6304500.1 hypothetical protein [Parabacteroides sp. PH5-39]MDH6315347.1 hypothetical protein [Parabacteroides sp. PF5-13]MDH6319159.1 hypothetical protein [Parabacteroides sp. PH5-13]MDH6322889.1 hypothetical protein [Parabacteroides sp. PH5-8]MDH6326539.1 hypothetical protein [Parabacteroides sp. PH5-41]
MKKKRSVTERTLINVQLLTAILLTLSGIVLLFSSFWVEPEGVIDSSVLVAFGEISTFAGALFGVDYSYKIKKSNI